jgi:RNA polymerase sigma factor (TIGR02999 family)
MSTSDASHADDAESRTLQELFPIVYPVLRKRAAQCMRGESPGHTLQATALVHDVYLKLAHSPQTYRDQHHLYAVVTNVMRQILIDHARARATRKRGGDFVRVPLDNACKLADDQGALFLDVQETLERFRARDPLRARIFDLSFLMGLTHQEIADLCEIDLAKVKYGLDVARAVLRQGLAARSTTDTR